MPISPLIFHRFIKGIRSRCRRTITTVANWAMPLAVVVMANSLAFCAEKERLPNIVLILADDLGFGDLGCYGHPTFKTPRLDRLATEGARLTQFNTPMPYCAPTRAALLTGRYPFRHGMTSNPAPDGGPAADALALSKDEVTLAEILKKAGYATGMVGKWHLGHKLPEQLPTGRGFEEYLGIPYSNDMRPVTLFQGAKPIEYPLVQANLTKRYTDRAVEFVKKNKDRPFFLYLAHAMPHKPLAVSEGFYKKSKAGLYADVMAELDASIGTLLDEIKSLGLEENTLVMFSSDNGPWYGGSTGGLRGMKGSSYEGGYRVPCLIRWPGRVPAGKVVADQAVMMDLFATSIEAAKIKTPPGKLIDGRDLLPRINGKGSAPHGVIFGHHGSPIAWVRDQRWKLNILPPRDTRLGKIGERWIDPRGPDGVTILAPYEQYQPSDYPGVRTGDAPIAMSLYDLQNDPAEQRNVADQHPEVVTRLKAKYDEILNEFPNAGPPKK